MPDFRLEVGPFVRQSPMAPRPLDLRAYPTNRRDTRLGAHEGPGSTVGDPRELDIIVSSDR